MFSKCINFRCPLIDDTNISFPHDDTVATLDELVFRSVANLDLEQITQFDDFQSYQSTIVQDSLLFGDKEPVSPSNNAVNASTLFRNFNNQQVSAPPDNIDVAESFVLHLLDSNNFNHFVRVCCELKIMEFSNKRYHKFKFAPLDRM